MSPSRRMTISCTAVGHYLNLNRWIRIRKCVCRKREIRSKKKETKTDEEEVPKWHRCLVLRYVPFIYLYIFFGCGMRMYCMLSSKILFCKLKLLRTCSLVKSVYVMETIIYSIHTCYRNGSCYFKYMRQNIFSGFHTLGYSKHWIVLTYYRTSVFHRHLSAGPIIEAHAHGKEADNEGKIEHRKSNWSQVASAAHATFMHYKKTILIKVFPRWI